MNNVSKKKIAAGYAVLLAVLLYSLFFSAPGNGESYEFG